MVLRIWDVLYYISSSFHRVFKHEFLYSSLRVTKLWSWVPCCLCSEYSFPLWAWLKIVDGKLWLSFEYKSCSLFNLDVFRIFVWYHCYCGIKVIKWEATALLLFVGVDCFCRSSGGSVRSLCLLIVPCVRLLVLRIAYGQVVLLQTVLNFVAWQLEKASKCSAVVYTLSLVIWITST
jgi:hypothetical protein